MPLSFGKSQEVYAICKIVGTVRRLLQCGEPLILFHLPLHQEFTGAGRNRFFKTFRRNGIFSKNYVKSGIFGKEYSKILTEAFEIRSESDYDDYYVISKEDVEEQIKNSQFFQNGITEYVNRILASEDSL